jgi:hypothetical protein
LKFEIRNFKPETAAIILLLLTGCGKPVEPLPPGEFAVHATLSANTLRVGDPVTLTLTARHPAGSTISFPNVESGKEVVIRGRAPENKELTKEILESEERYQLTSFRVGEWTIVTNPVVCTFSNGTQKAQSLPELVLHVQSSLNATNATKLSDIKDIVKPPLQIPHKLWIFLIIALLALIAGLITLLFLRKKKTGVPAAPPLPPHILARLALDSLKAKAWNPEPFFTELSLILRTYLENRFSLNAPESTTEELTCAMSSDVRLDIKEQQTLRNFMTQADLVKFARDDAQQDVMQTAFTTFEAFVDQTTEKYP